VVEVEVHEEGSKCLRARAGELGCGDRVKFEDIDKLGRDGKQVGILGFAWG